MIVVSYGGGTNSTAMLVGMYEKGINPDLILFADTGGEKPHTYEHIKKMQIWLGKIGFPLIHIVKAKNTTLEQDCLKRKALPSIAYGGFKTCSQRFKVQPQEVWMNSYDPANKIWNSGKKVTKAIGFDADEPQRAKTYKDKKYSQWYPLLDWDWGRDECMEAIKRAGLPQPGKSSCFFCPNSKTSEIKELNAQYPELMLRAIDMENNAELTTIKGLGRGWKWGNLIKTDDMFDFPDRFSEMPCNCYDG
jgi:hypothetical protein